MVELSELEEKECDCETCRSMCRTVPCWGTPKEIKRLIDEGLSTALHCVTYWTYDGNIYILSPKVKYHGFHERYIGDVKRGECIFLTDDGLCSLHDEYRDGHRLKPMEGRLVDHNSQRGVDDPHDAIAELWKSDFAQDLVDKWLNGEI